MPLHLIMLRDLKVVALVYPEEINKAFTTNWTRKNNEFRSSDSSNILNKFVDPNILPGCLSAVSHSPILFFLLI